MIIYERWAYRSAEGFFFKTPEDSEFAIQNLHVRPDRGYLVPFGIELEKMPDDIKVRKEEIYTRHSIPGDCTLIFFNGAFNYKPNTDALRFILDKLNPLLLNESPFPYRILICGKDLPGSFDQLSAYKEQNIIYAGFVDDVVTYFKAADIFLNPITTGGGVKTKIVDAMGYGVTVVPCATGAAGIDRSVCGEKIRIVADDNEQEFAKAIRDLAAKEKAETPPVYYQYYYWGNIIGRINKVFEN